MAAAARMAANMGKRGGARFDHQTLDPKSNNLNIGITYKDAPDQVLEPRRLAARAAAVRMAANMGERVGESIGYRTRMERRVGRNARIEVVTTGVLLRRLQRVSAPDRCVS